MKELNALSAQINISLFCDLMAFIINTAKVNLSQVETVRSRCIIPFYGKGSTDFQEKYGFLYLGELLERYEERFGMTVPDLRAIALALAYAAPLTPEDMFVGTQRVDFLQRVRGAAAGDTYLTGALYLLQEGQAGSVELKDALTQKPYQQTEELLFALSLFTEKEDAFQQFKPSLLRMLGSDRSIPLLGNMELFVWLIEWIRPLLKQYRAKDLALFRALCALPTSFVKEGDRHYQTLSDAGYTPLEIAYANIMAVWLCRTGKRLCIESVVTEKIVIRLFERVLGTDLPLASDVYEQLTELFGRYKTFSIKCYGWHFLRDALDDNVQIQDPETFRWFTTLAPLSHAAFQGFDILDPHWDKLASTMALPKYTELFENGLNDEMDPEDINARIARFDQLTGRDYLDGFFSDSEQMRFSLLVDKDIIDLWDVFQKGLDEKGAIVQVMAINRVRNYLRNVRSIQAFHFFERFLPQYGFQGEKKYLGDTDFVAGIFSNYSRYTSDRHIKFKMDQPYLDDEKRRLILYWLSEFFFQEEIEHYLSFILAVLTDDAAARLLTTQECRVLYDTVMADKQLTRDYRETLKRLYQTEEEKEAERLAEEARKREAAEQERLALIQRVQEKFEEISDGTVSSLLNLIKTYRFSYQEGPIAFGIVRDQLKSQVSGSLLEAKECIYLLELCSILAKEKVMSYTEVRQIIDTIKEVPIDGTSDSDDRSD